MFKRPWHLGLLALLSVGLPSEDAQATTLTPLTVEQMTDASDLIVRGVITEIWTEMDDRGYVWTRIQLEVTQDFKGESDDAIVIDQLGGVHHNDYLVMPSAPRFSVGEEGVFFLEHLGNGRTTTVGMFQGKYTVRIDPDSGREMLVRYLVRQDLPYDHRFIPHPAAADRIFFDDVEQQVLDRVERGWDGEPIPGASAERLRRINTLQPGVE